MTLPGNPKGTQGVHRARGVQKERVLPKAKEGVVAKAAAKAAEVMVPRKSHLSKGFKSTH